MVPSEKIVISLVLYFTNLMVYTFLMLTHCLHCNVNYFVFLFYYPVATNHESESISEGRSSSLGAILGALFAFIILGAIVAGFVYYLIR